MRRCAVLIAVALSLGVLGACGDDETSITDKAAAELHTQVSAVRAAVDARDAAGATRALSTLRASLDRLQRSGDVTDERATEILAAARAVEAQLVSITTTTTTLPPTTTGGRGKDKDNDKGQGNGKGQKSGEG